MADTFNTTVPGLDAGPAIGAVAIDYAAADQALTGSVRGVYIDTDGHLVVDTARGDTVTFSNLVAGTVYPFAITKIYKLGSSAAGLVLY